jgi:hypothetical protein
MKKLFFIPLALAVLASCGGDDSYVAPIEYVSGGGIFGTAENPLNVGGPNELNEVFVDLSEQATSESHRETWDLGFYSGEGFHVVINGALRMAAKQLETTDITAVQVQDATVAVGTFNPVNMNYIDHPDGSINQTAFGDLATSEAEAKVYLVNLGGKVPMETPPVGSSNVSSGSRGWKKVKVWVDGDMYKLQYAALDATTPTTVSIAKDPAYNHVFYSFAQNSVVLSEPEKDKWDLNFTCFTNEVFQGTETAGAYFFSDFIVTNTKAGVTAFMITESQGLTFQTFTADMLNQGDYAFSNDQRAVGANWRNVTPVQVYDYVFFVVQDAGGAVYKIKFISMLNAAGERGFPMFQYELLQ